MRNHSHVRVELKGQTVEAWREEPLPVPAVVDVVQDDSSAQDFSALTSPTDDQEILSERWCTGLWLFGSLCLCLDRQMPRAAMPPAGEPRQEHSTVRSTAQSLQLIDRLLGTPVTGII